MEALRNIFRRKGRSLLTIGGIFIGMLTLTILGALAEKMNILITGTERFFTSQIMVLPQGADRGAIASNTFLSEAQVASIMKIEGVQEAIPMISMMIQSDDGAHLQFGFPPMIQALDLKAPYNHWKELSLRSGTMLQVGEQGGAVVGADLADQLGARVGQPVSLNGMEFIVKGIAAKTMAGPDSMALISLADGRDMLLKSHPQLRKMQAAMEALGDVQLLDIDSMVSAIMVVWQEDADPEVVSERIRSAMADVHVVSPDVMRRFMQQAMVLINVVTLGAAGIALVVGGISVVNTMMMAVTERISEIGIKMVIGASSRQIVKEFMGEAGIIGFIGGVLGLSIGSVVVFFVNNATANQGVHAFQVTPRLVVVGLSFAVLLGVIAGSYPAYRASRLNCVDALRGG